MDKSGWVVLDSGESHLKTSVGLAPLRKGAPESSRVLKLTVEPEDPKQVDRVAAFLETPAAAVQSPPIPVKASQMVRIRVRLLLPQRMPAGGGGLIVRDSLGGELLQFRSTDPIPDWTELTLYRRAPADGDLVVTLGLAGIGTASFDDLRIDVLGSVRGGGGVDPTPDLADGRPSPRPPSSSTPGNRLEGGERSGAPRAAATRRGQTIR